MHPLTHAEDVFTVALGKSLILAPVLMPVTLVFSLCSRVFSLRSVDSRRRRCASRLVPRLGVYSSARSVLCLTPLVIGLRSHSPSEIINAASSTFPLVSANTNANA